MADQYAYRQAIINTSGAVEMVLHWDGTVPFYNPGGYVVHNPFVESGDQYDIHEHVFFKKNATKDNMRLAVVNKRNVVVCVIHWPDNESFTEPEGYKNIISKSAQVGDIYDPDSDEFSRPSNEREDEGTQ